VHQLAVRKSVQASARADALYPQPPELPLLIAAIAIRKAIGAIGGLLRGLKQLRFGKEKSLGPFQVFLAARAPLCTAFYSGHCVFSCEESTRRADSSAQRRLHGVLDCGPEFPSCDSPRIPREKFRTDRSGWPAGPPWRDTRCLAQQKKFEYAQR
jgi:hypothetical protein